MCAVQRGNHAQVVQAALLVGQNGTRPHFAPAVLRHQALKIAIEVVGVGRRLVDVLVAKHLPAHGHTLVVKRLVGHGVSFGNSKHAF
jgi:hypothetical protein